MNSARSECCLQRHGGGDGPRRVVGRVTSQTLSVCRVRAVKMEAEWKLPCTTVAEAAVTDSRDFLCKLRVTSHDHDAETAVFHLHPLWLDSMAASWSRIEDMVSNKPEI